MEYLQQCFGWRKEGKKCLCRMEEKGIGETLQEAQSIVLKVWAQPSPSRALGKQNLTEGNVIFWWELLEKAAQSCT